MYMQHIDASGTPTRSEVRCHLDALLTELSQHVAPSLNYNYELVSPERDGKGKGFSIVYFYDNRVKKVLGLTEPEIPQGYAQSIAHVDLTEEQHKHRERIMFEFSEIEIEADDSVSVSYHNYSFSPAVDGRGRRLLDNVLQLQGFDRKQAEEVKKLITPIIRRYNKNAKLWHRSYKTFASLYVLFPSNSLSAYSASQIMRFYNISTYKLRTMHAHPSTELIK